MAQQSIDSRQNGFTLVELAIVLMIIGLLVGGILRGQELLINSRVTSTIEQVKAYKGAMHTFRDIYDSLPGDFSIADKHLPGCNTTSNCQSGNGDGLIGAVLGTKADEPWSPVDTAILSENTQFWKHLSLAHLITGINPAAATPEGGKSNPAAKIGRAVFFMRYTVMNAYNMPKWTANILVLRKDIDGAFCDAIAGGFCAVSPIRASMIDRKMDDGSWITQWQLSITLIKSNTCNHGTARHLQTKSKRLFF